MASSQIPYTTKQGIFFLEQGENWNKQGILIGGSAKLRFEEPKCSAHVAAGSKNVNNLRATYHVVRSGMHVDGTFIIPLERCLLARSQRHSWLMPAIFGDRAPFLRFGRDESSEVLRRAWARFGTDLGQALLDRRGFSGHR
jgi:hypothetical protein